MLAAMVLSCAHADDATTSAQDIEVWPEDAEKLGSIQFDIPAADAPVDPVAVRFEQFMIGAPPGIPAVLPLEAGRAQQARIGEGVLVVEGPLGVRRMKVVIGSRQVSKIALGLVSLAYDRVDSITPEIDLGRSRTATRPGLSVFDAGEMITYALARQGGLDGQGLSYAPVPPRELTFFERRPWPDTDVMTKADFGGGAVRRLSIDRGPLTTEPPGVVRVVWPARATPDATAPLPSGCGASPDGLLALVAPRFMPDPFPPPTLMSPVDPKTICWRSWQTRDRAADDYVKAAIATTSDVRMYPTDHVEFETYRLVLNAFFTMDVVPVANQTTEVRIGRIDVHDIAVSHPDGSTTREKGTYTIAREPSTSVTVLGTTTSFVFPTETGVDVPPGRYHVRASCSVADCREPHEYVLDLP